MRAARIPCPASGETLAQGLRCPVRVSCRRRAVRLSRRSPCTPPNTCRNTRHAMRGSPQRPATIFPTGKTPSVRHSAARLPGPTAALGTIIAAGATPPCGRTRSARPAPAPRHRHPPRLARALRCARRWHSPAAASTGARQPEPATRLVHCYISETSNYSAHWYRIENGITKLAREGLEGRFAPRARTGSTFHVTGALHEKNHIEHAGGSGLGVIGRVCPTRA